MKIVLCRRGGDSLAPTRLKYHVKPSSFAQRSGGRLHVSLHSTTFLESTCASLRVVGQHTGVEREIGWGPRDEFVLLAAKIDFAKIRVADVNLTFVLRKLGDCAPCHDNRLSLRLDAEGNLGLELVADH